MKTPISQGLKLREAQVIVESMGQTRKHVIVNLTDLQEIATLFETPTAWTAIQSGQMLLRRGDTVSIVSGDGNTVADSCVVLDAKAGRVTLSKPLRMVQLEGGVLFTNGQIEVVAAGVGYSLKSVRDNAPEDRVFATVDAAKAAIFRRQPVKVA